MMEMTQVFPAGQEALGAPGRGRGVLQDSPGRPAWPGDRAAAQAALRVAHPAEGVQQGKPG